MIEYIVISESKIGIHAKVDTKNRFQLFALVFPIRISQDRDKKLKVSARLADNDTFKSVVEAAQGSSAKKVRFLVAFDLDEQGDLMAEAVQEALVKNGFCPYSIFRTPLTEKGYMAVRQFSDTTLLKEYLFHQQKLAELLKSKKLPEYSIRKIIALMGLHQSHTKEIEGGQPIARTILGRPNIDPIGTSTATAVHNYLMQTSTRGK